MAVQVRCPWGDQSTAAAIDARDLIVPTWRAASLSLREKHRQVRQFPR